jgi:hypothetical protein
MTCPWCQAELADPPPSKFCDGCGLALPMARARPGAGRAAAGGKGEAAVIRCGECGTVATSRRCRGCGARVRWPADVVPPDEEVQRPIPPALELDDDGGPGLELGEAHGPSATHVSATDAGATDVGATDAATRGAPGAAARVPDGPSDGSGRGA